MTYSACYLGAIINGNAIFCKLQFHLLTFVIIISTLGIIIDNVGL